MDELLRRRALMGAAEEPIDTSPIVTQYGGILQSNGEFASGANWYDVTDYYPKPGGIKIVIRTIGQYLSGTSTVAVCAFYDADKQFLSHNSIIMSKSGTDAYGTWTPSNGSRADAVFFRTILGRNHAEDSYAYVHTTGEIIFAGKNTEYYSKRNINS